MKLFLRDLLYVVKFCRMIRYLIEIEIHIFFVKKIPTESRLQCFVTDLLN